MTTILHIPFPPSANRLWRAVNGRNIKSGHYRLWEREAVLTIKSQVPGFKTINGPYHLTIKATAPDRRARDIDNLPKALNDALASAGVIANDSNCRVLHIFWANEVKKGGAIEVIVKEAA